MQNGNIRKTKGRRKEDGLEDRRIFIISRCHLCVLSWMSTTVRQEEQEEATTAPPGASGPGVDSDASGRKEDRPNLCCEEENEPEVLVNLIKVNINKKDLVLQLHPTSCW